MLGPAFDYCTTAVHSLRKDLSRRMRYSHLSQRLDDLRLALTLGACLNKLQEGLMVSDYVIDVTHEVV